MTTDDVAALSFEAALAELDSLITRLEGGAVDLDEAIAYYERGSRLAQRCAELLDRTEAKVMQLVVGPQGVPEERPLQAAPEPAAVEAASGASRPARATRPAPGPRISAPPPPSAPVRARPASSPALFPGLDPAPRPREADPTGAEAEDAGFDLDDIPF